MQRVMQFREELGAGQIHNGGRTQEEHDEARFSPRAVQQFKKPVANVIDVEIQDRAGDTKDKHVGHALVFRAADAVAKIVCARHAAELRRLRARTTPQEDQQREDGADQDAAKKSRN